jgi:hypothetical protein
MIHQTAHSAGAGSQAGGRCGSGGIIAGRRAPAHPERAERSRGPVPDFQIAVESRQEAQTRREQREESREVVVTVASLALGRRDPCAPTAAAPRCDGQSGGYPSSSGGGGVGGGWRDTAIAARANADTDAGVPKVIIAAEAAPRKVVGQREEHREHSSAVRPG